MLKTLSTNRLTSHPSFAKVMSEYNAVLRSKGRVNARKFYFEVILPEIPDYKIDSWYYFLNRLKKNNEVVELPVGNSNLTPTQEGEAAVATVSTTLMTNQAATARAIQLALNISADRLKQIAEHPELLSATEAAKLFTLAMKAQDSRVKAVGMIRSDNREQERFDAAMDSSSF